MLLLHLPYVIRIVFSLPWESWNIQRPRRANSDITYQAAFDTLNVETTHAPLSLNSQLTG